ncbi:MAG TPA: hypothetical protein VM695_07255 [Phycisphaerae bacterium]|nr:hypothetical protein [Phycisphaerae bacterium]
MAEERENGRNTIIPGLCLLGLLIVGALGIGTGFWAIIHGQFLEGAACLLAAAVALGITAHVSYR